MSSSSSNEVLSWAEQDRDPKKTQLFNPYGALYRFQVPCFNCMILVRLDSLVELVWLPIGDGFEPRRADSHDIVENGDPDQEEKVAKLEWASNGSLGQAVIGKATLPGPIHCCKLANLADFVSFQHCRVFTGPEGSQDRWRPDLPRRVFFLQ